ncbi:TPA: DUF5375 family protein [Escherichia coli]|nr:DUF5375 family protein [Escherichia coli]
MFALQPCCFVILTGVKGLLYPHLTLESLEAAIAAELEGFYLRQHGEEKGRQIACALLEDLMESGPLKAAPSLSFLGLVVMDELCARHIKAPVLH